MQGSIIEDHLDAKQNWAVLLERPFSSVFGCHPKLASNTAMTRRSKKR